MLELKYAPVPHCSATRRTYIFVEPSCIYDLNKISLSFPRARRIKKSGKKLISLLVGDSEHGSVVNLRLLACWGASNTRPCLV
jgi:hypothetical protein